MRTAVRFGALVLLYSCAARYDGGLMLCTTCPYFYTSYNPSVGTYHRLLLVVPQSSLQGLQERARSDLAVRVTLHGGCFLLRIKILAEL